MNKSCFIAVKKSLFLICFAVGLLLASHHNANSADGEAKKSTAIDRFKKPMPEMQPLEMEKFIELTEEHKDIPYNDKSLAYSIRWPKGWEKGEDKKVGNFDLNTKLFTSISIFHGPPRMGGRSRLEIKAVDLQYQLTAEQWYLQYVLESGQTLEGFIVHSERKVEALKIVMEHDTSYYVRSTILLNGRRVLMAQYYVPMFFWNDEKALQARCVQSFKELYPREDTIENMAAFQFLDIAEVKYPESWKIWAKPLKDVNKMNIKFLNVRETITRWKQTQESIEGQVDATLVSSLSSDSLLREIEEYKKTLEGTGMLVGTKMYTEPELDYNENFSFAVTEVYEGIDSTNDSIDYELWFTVMVSGNYYYFITLLTPSRNESYFTWARNSQTYKIIIEGITPSSGGFLEQ